MAERYEYHAETFFLDKYQGVIGLEGRLNELSEDGWRCIAVTPKLLAWDGSEIIVVLERSEQSDQSGKNALQPDSRVQEPGGEQEE